MHSAVIGNFFAIRLEVYFLLFSLFVFSPSSFSAEKYCKPLDGEAQCKEVRIGSAALFTIALLESVVPYCAKYEEANKEIRQFFRDKQWEVTEVKRRSLLSDYPTEYDELMAGNRKLHKDARITEKQRKKVCFKWAKSIKESDILARDLR
ncbi:hypothetical protein [Pseudoalteromonas phenolica]|uniref:hypothetical protein n=1 Tax=Pseudoalteromonas phenolica TaxID=161398 RepID=UPI00110B8C70|nr:hypothetical protein [Pseudoalteromonas phenolica]TMO57985.1 hypothetical protein CWC21_01655 [Pseudoalteromonas phenolica]